MEERLAAYRARKLEEVASRLAASHGARGSSSGGRNDGSIGVLGSALRAAVAGVKSLLRRPSAHQGELSASAAGNGDSSQVQQQDGAPSASSSAVKEAAIAPAGVCIGSVRRGSKVPAGRSRLDWAALALRVLLWLIGWGLFIEIEFGAVYFVISLLTFIVVNTRSSPPSDGRRRGDQPSAYSVFNPNCERIDGTITAEQFESEILRRSY